MSKLTYRIEYDRNPIDPRLVSDQYTQGEIEAFQQGEVYGFLVERVTNDGIEIVDQNWGFYGEPGRLFAIECAEWCIKQQEEDQ